MELCWVLPDNRSINRLSAVEDFYYANVNEAILAEQQGFDSVLVSSTPDSFDPWILASNISSQTNLIRILVAQNTNHVLPTYSAKATNTLNIISNDRVDINVVTGSSKVGLSKDSKFDNHETRYKRTHEYMEVILMLRAGRKNFDGEFFNIHNCDIFPKENSNHSARYFIAGSSNNSLSVAAQFGDYHVSYGDTFDKTSEKIKVLQELSHQYNRSVRSGIYLHIIARRTSTEAWEAANDLLSIASSKEKKLVHLYFSSVDSVGIQRHKQFLSDPINQHQLWGGLAKISTTVSLSIVGSYKEVIDTLNRYYDIGVKYFLLVSFCNDHEIERLGSYVLPYLK